MATYKCELAEGQQIYIENQGMQTAIALVSSGSDQQQSQRNSFETGTWQVPPTAFQTPSGVVLRIEAEGQHFIQVHANRMTKLDDAPSLSNADVLPLRKVDEMESRQSLPDMQPMEPMQPMPPMQMNNMEMRMEPMTMRMGNMEMRMETAPEQRQSVKNFCSQCGSKVEQGDYFCSHCGNSLALFKGQLT